ncbi:Txe/YoeB family addiction module toxin [Streptomyces sp. NPDC058291]|uniref:Txe/YoeB family addiction module toxin n=1 Tax=Streptomyces sp. NPDC058291 TaxID=3346427 RepID=UPI0036EB95AE
MRNVRFTPDGWDDFVYWATTDPKMCRRLAKVIDDCRRHPFAGIGKPEPLRGELSGFWSRRNNDEHRLVYAVEDQAVVVLKARHHYG